MASKFLCDCGEVVRTNSFEGHGVYSLITDNDIDKLKEPISEKDLTDLWFNSQKMVECSRCGTFYLWNEENNYYVAYKKIDG